MAKERINTRAVIDRIQTQHGSIYNPKSKFYGWFSGACLSLIVLSVVGGFYINVERVVTAKGKVIPTGMVKTVEHLEGGIVASLNVKEGEYVKEGQLLIVLDLATKGMNIEELESRTGSMRLSMDRLIAEASGHKKVIFDPPVASKYPKLHESELNTFNARQRDRQSQKEVLRQSSIASLHQIEELRSKIEGIEANLESVEKEFGITETLAKDGLVSKLEALRLKKQRDTLFHERKAMLEKIAVYESDYKTTLARLNSVDGVFQSDAAQEMTRIRLQYESEIQKLDMAKKQQTRSEIRSPIDGYVKDLNVQTVGNVISNGSKIMNIVPAGGELVIETQLSPMDRGLVSTDQPAEVKISTFDFIKYGSLSGKVVQIGADTTSSNVDAPYYRVIVKTEAETLKGEFGDLRKIEPGMEAEVDIKIGHENFMMYLLNPVLKLQKIVNQGAQENV